MTSTFRGLEKSKLDPALQCHFKRRLGVERTYIFCDVHLLLTLKKKKKILGLVADPMKRKSSESDTDRPATSGVTGIPTQSTATTTSSMAHEKTQQSAKRMGKRPGRKPSKIDQRAKLERSRQSARECRARKKLRYQYLEELVSSREKAVFSLREEVEMYKRWSVDLDRGVIPESLLKLLAQEESMQKGRGGSPPSHSSTPTASPASSVPDTEHGTFHQGAPAQAQPATHYMAEQGRRQQLTRQPAVHQQLSTIVRGCRSFEDTLQSSSSSLLASSPSSVFASSSAVAAAASSSSSSSSSLVYRSGSVPNLTASHHHHHHHHHHAHHGLYPASHPASTNIGTASSLSSSSSSATITTTTTAPVFRDYPEDSGSSLNSTGFLPDQLSLLGSVMMEADPDASTPTTINTTNTTTTNANNNTNIPTVVTHHSPPPAPPATKPGSAWTWDHPHHHHPHHHHTAAQQSSQSRTYPYTCVSGGVQPSHSLPRQSSASHSHPHQSSALHGGVSVSGGEGVVFCSSKPESPVPNFLLSRSSSSSTVSAGGRTVVRNPSAGSVRSVSSISSSGGGGSAVPFYQRPRSSSDLARRVTSSSMIPSPSISSSSSSSLTSSSSPSTSHQQNLPVPAALFESPPAVSTAATSTAYSSLGVRGGGGGGYPLTVADTSSLLQDTAPVCMGSDLSLSASISEPLPHWYSFLDDLENAASFSARQGAFSEAGTPGGSSRGGRSGPGTPSSVDSPYSQQQLLQQQQNQDGGGGSDGNIPNIISDLLGQSHSS